MTFVWYALGAIAALIIVGIVVAIVSPRMFVRGFFRPLLALLYRKRVHGIENLPKDGGCVIISNHVSWIDGILILWMMPRNVRFVVDAGNFNQGFTKWLAAAFNTIMMGPGPKSIGPRAQNGA